MRTARAFIMVACFVVIGAFTCLSASAGNIDIGSLDGGRSARPFLGGDFDNIRADLLNPANFGPSGINQSTVSFAPAVSTITPANLAPLEVFVLTETNALSVTE